MCSIIQGCVAPTDMGEDAPLIDNPSVREMCAWSLRCLRNACVQSPPNQQLVWNAGALDSLKQLIQLISSAPPPLQEELAACLRCAVQLLGNLISGQVKLQAPAWKEVFPRTLLSVFQCADPKASQYLCMFINMCIQSSSPSECAQQLWTSEDGYQLVETVIAMCETESEPDFSLQLLQTLIVLPDFIPSIFDHLTPPSKIILLDIVAAFLSQGHADGPFAPEAASGNADGQKESPSLPAVEFVAQVFEQEAGSIFGLVSEEEWSNIEKDKKPQLVMRLLNALCEATAHPEAKRNLQERVSLLACSLDLLERANNAGKKGNNHFTATQTLEGASAQMNPLFGFKRDLVRLIGNMCHNYTANQNKIRELHGIPVLLEHCSIDDSNPFISQWAIFALRNLCDGNLENQAVIAEMSNQGVVNNEQLEKYGFQAEWREGRMYYRSTKKK
ncbi:ataxin-10-like isoform X2 [Acanthaster planci]|nr:ataxin-10-like isoform X2 [Acanthaster planci]XP_022107818.1 ataxin-10-like isoform X2 [Acanthaster planci]XP_022107819.1 ataxin-10-like isoform X2 [Acanthaster planci]